MECTPYRHYLAWMYWRSNQLNKPSLTDHYLMQVAQEVRRVLSKEPNNILLDDFRIKFRQPTEEELAAMRGEEEELTPEEIAERDAIQRSYIFACVGYKPHQAKAPKEEAK